MNYTLAGVKAGKPLSQQLAIDSAYTIYDLGHDDEKSDEQKGKDALGKGLGTATSIGSDKVLLNKGVNSVARQIITNVIGGYVENRVKESNKKEEDKK